MADAAKQDVGAAYNYIPFSERPSCTIQEATRATGLSRTTLYEKNSSGRALDENRRSPAPDQCALAARAGRRRSRAGQISQSLKHETPPLAGRRSHFKYSKGVSTMTIAHEESERNAREPTIVAQWELNRRESVCVGGAAEIADNRPVTFCTVIGDATYCDARYTRTTGSLSNFFAREELMLCR
jgi:hypothetical protein